jgi:hypothetical protein
MQFCNCVAVLRNVAYWTRNHKRTNVTFHVEYCGGQSGTGTDNIFPRVLRFSAVNIIPQLLHIYSYIVRGMDKGLVRSPVSQRHSFTQSQ